ncbi:MAG: DUF192 domain-containing protein [Candidatus Pacebacteria bacterium]|nr:DUF192 domain-containing protein [Candidatus Paceibacterota bacterium]MCF7862980.1 DUF192 domain-containing protein [Candidatus Paceibacterota bacterium]
MHYSKGSIGNIIVLIMGFLVVAAIWDSFEGKNSPTNEDPLKNEYLAEKNKEFPQKSGDNVTEKTTFVNQRGFFHSANIKLKNKVLNVKIADTYEKRAQGLSGVSRMSESIGMLFIFDTLDKHGFWMKDMNISIDIIWFDEYFRIVHIKERASPHSFPEVFSPNTSAKYVLETVSGFSQKNNLKLGDKFQFVP